MSRDIERDFEICSKATPGPWVGFVSGVFNGEVRAVPDDDSFTLIVEVNEMDDRPEDIIFIATAREALPYYINAYKEALVRDVKHMDRRATLKKQLDKATSERDSLKAEVERLRELCYAVDGWLNATPSNQPEAYSELVEAFKLARSALEGDGK